MGKHPSAFFFPSTFISIFYITCKFGDPRKENCDMVCRPRRAVMVGRRYASIVIAITPLFCFFIFIFTQFHTLKKYIKKIEITEFYSHTHVVVDVYIIPCGALRVFRFVHCVPTYSGVSLYIYSQKDDASRRVPSQGPPCSTVYSSRCPH